MRGLPRAATVLAAVTLLVLLSGCTSKSPDATASPADGDTPQPTPSGQRGVTRSTSSAQILGSLSSLICANPAPNSKGTWRVEGEVVLGADGKVVANMTLKAMYTGGLGLVYSGLAPFRFTLTEDKPVLTSPDFDEMTHRYPALDSYLIGARLTPPTQDAFGYVKISGRLRDSPFPCGAEFGPYLLPFEA